MSCAVCEAMVRKFKEVYCVTHTEHSIRNEKLVNQFTVLEQKFHDASDKIMHLAACGVAAMCNTEKSIFEQPIDKTNPYWSASYQDVLNCVMREIDLRKERDAYRAALEWMEAGYAGMFGRQTVDAEEEAWEMCSVKVIEVLELHFLSKNLTM